MIFICVKKFVELILKIHLEKEKNNLTGEILRNKIKRLLVYFVA